MVVDFVIGWLETHEHALLLSSLTFWLVNIQVAEEDKLTSRQILVDYINSSYTGKILYVLIKQILI